jgi:two-component system response regulator YesN
MFTVMIVDDEDPVLNSFSFMITHDAAGYQVGGVARSGIEAIKLCPQIHPDVIIMDIAMPGLDGLQTISRLKEDFPQIKFIVSSAYERFDIAQRAIPLGVFRYLVKPVSKKNLLDTLAELKIHLEDQRNRTQVLVQEAELAVTAQELEKRQFFHHLAASTMNESLWNTYKQQLSIPLDTGLVMLIHLPSITNPEEQSQMYQRIVQAIARTNHCLDFEAGRLNLFMSTRKSPDVIKELLVNQILPSITQDFILGLGDLVEGPSLALSYRKALEQISKQLGRNSEEKARLMSLRKASALVLKGVGDSITSPSDPNSVQATDRIVNRTTSKTDSPAGLTHQLNQQVQDYWQYLKENFTFTQAKAKIIVLFAHLFDDAIDPAEILPDPAIDLADADHEDQINLWIMSTLALLKDLSAQLINSDLPPPLQKALGIVRSRFSEPLQLNTLAEVCSVSPSYLSRLFSDHLQTTFIDVINTIRIAEAERLIKEEGFSVKVASYTVGFQDPNYFSRAFKKYRGYSPSDSIKRRAHENS